MPEEIELALLCGGTLRLNSLNLKLEPITHGAIA